MYELSPSREIGLFLALLSLKFCWKYLLMTSKIGGKFVVSKWNSILLIEIVYTH